MPVLMADYVDKAVSRDLCAVCEEMGNGEEYSWVFQTYCWWLFFSNTTFSQMSTWFNF